MVKKTRNEQRVFSIFLCLAWYNLILESNFIPQADSDSDFEPDATFEEDEDDLFVLDDQESVEADLEDLTDHKKKASKSKKQKVTKKVIQ